MLLVKVGVVIPAAGQGKRMGAPINKQFLLLAGRPILSHTLDIFEESDYVEEIVIVCSQADRRRIEELVRQEGFKKVSAIVLGGKERQESVFAGLKAISPSIERVAVHDGARPLLTCFQLDCFLAETEKFRAALMAVPVKDTIKLIDESGRVQETPPRNLLRAIQTPQVFERKLLAEAHEKALEAGYLATDDGALVEWLGYPVHTLPGSTENIKITTPEDLVFATSILEKRKKEKEMIRVGIGFDVHALVEGRPLILGGVEIPYTKGLMGHSDADVVTHALMDALLGALALGDIGQHFPDTDEAYRGISSLKLLEQVMKLIVQEGYGIGNVDCIIMAQKPKLAPYLPSIRESLSKALQTKVENVSVKATTTEKLGFVGREEGISSQVIVSLRKTTF
ncbi:MAG: 2-C-methyl-D-erythritol 4-phosphate cytidylyltransferase [Desulfitobacterium sp.]|nr:2-C-methyl-D-erythritol 4-phosphate cytidylyltransferase [Desulfitobacterium sp.]